MKFRNMKSQLLNVIGYLSNTNRCCMSAVKCDNPFECFGQVLKSSIT